MKNTRFVTMIIVLMGLVLAACSVTQLSSSSSGSDQPSTALSSTQDSGTSSGQQAASSNDPQSGSQGAVNNQQDTPASNGASQPIEDQLAAGTLKLEGTDQAVTAEQAAALLPLWKAVKSLSTSDTVAQDEITALYNQIKEAMTSEQLQAIEGMNLTQEDMTALMESFGIEAPQGDPANMNEATRATRLAQMPAPGEGGQPPEGGTGGRGGGPGGGMPGSATPEMQGTPPAGMGGRGAGGGMNTLFVDTLIQLLEDRAGSS